MISSLVKRSIIPLLMVLLALGAGIPAMSQPLPQQLSPEAFLAIVRQYHPVVRQAGIDVDIARQQLLASRGLLDPSIYFNADRKTFDSKNYYNYFNGELKIPTWFGVDFFAGVENNNGLFTNDEITIGQSSYAGLMVPLAKNLVYDRRRATIEQSKIFVEMSKADRELAVNDLLFDAIDAYWFWALQYQLLQVLTDAVRINEDRYKLIQVTVVQGDRAGVDSTEALTQILIFRNLRNEAEMNFITAGLELSNFLWQKNNTPYQLPSNIVPAVALLKPQPADITYAPLAEYVQAADANHPKLRNYGFKLDALDVERRLKFQSLLPTVNFKYNALARDYEFWKGWNATSLRNNFKYGIDVGMPLFLRQGRGDYKAAKLKIESTAIEQDATRLSIDNKVKSYYTQLLQYQQQITIAEQSLAAYQKVFEVEKLRFDIGESSLFLINSRENKVLEAQQKLSELRAKFYKTLYGVQWAAGVLR
ncbi:MAG: TolC family protein [Bacteroidetes bacterium]|nr:MAG: TolC family protein [Bacteroidota bacterium]